jgi:UDP-GlcNAc3NAcA epimerase
LKIVTVVGARPQFIKAAAVSRAIKAHNDALASGSPSASSHQLVTEVIIHTGQHYDDNMSRVFFEELAIPEADYHLGIGSGGHGAQTGTMLVKLEKVLQDEGPDWVLIYGDTNSTLAGALAAVKLHIPVVHVEAGLRSFNRSMPEEINRILVDQVSDLLFCPSQSAMKNLASEGIVKGVHLVGDVMYEALLFASEQARRSSTIIEVLGLTNKKYLLVTVHRAENTDDQVRLSNIMQALERLAERETVIFPIHPRTRKSLEELNYDHTRANNNLKLIDPVGYIDMVMLEQEARIILTDSGGIQKESYWLGIPCITMRDETE